MFQDIKWPTLLICIAVPVILGLLSGYASVESISGWYNTLNKPSFNPPNAIFGPVWTILYILMGISLYIVVESFKSATRKRGILLFVIQLVLNMSWSFVFFNLQSPVGAMITIIFLWIAILLMILIFAKISRIAAYLQLPYLLWVTFASILNAAIWYLNPS